MCVCVCPCVYMCLCVNIWVCVCVCACICISVCLCVYVYVCVCVCLCVYVCTCVYVCMSVWAHEEDVTHRDIKSANIMITDKGQVKIMDFGLAKVRGGAQVTKIGTTLGTAAYMSPEQARGEEADHRSDIWSFGVVLYEMLTGKLPFGGDYEQAVMYSILNEEPTAVTNLRPNVPGAVQTIMEKALNKNPHARYQIIDDLLIDIANFTRQQALIKPKSTITPRKLVFTGVGLLLAFVIIFSLNKIRFFGTDRTSPTTDISTQTTVSIAILPFSDLSPGKDQEYFCDGMTEQLITNLSKLQQLKVIARTSALKFKNTEKSIAEIGTELNVGHILEGSIRKSGNRIRVTAKLVKVEDSFHVWGNDYDRDLQDIFAVQDEVSEEIAKALLSELNVNTLESLKTRQTENTKAYEFYLKGEYFHYSRFFVTFQEEDFKKSESMFQKALELDPDYALAYAGLADLYNTYWGNINRDQKYLDLQQINIDKAFALAPNLAEVNNKKGWVHTAKGEMDEAFQSYKRALDINPNYALANHSMGVFLQGRGLYHQAIDFYNKAIELNPLFPRTYMNRGREYFALGEYSRADADFQRTLEIEPKHLATFQTLTWTQINLKQYDKAEESIAKCEELRPASRFNGRLRARLFAAKGQKEQALALSKGVSVYLLLGMKEEALEKLANAEWLHHYLAEWLHHYLSLANLPIYDNIRSDPRFKKILEKAKSAYEKNLQKYGGAVVR